MLTATWDGTGDGVNWFDPFNWDNDQTPGAGEDVEISASAGSIIFDGDASIGNLTTEKTIVLEGGTLEVDGDLTTLSGATFTLDASVNDGVLSGANLTAGSVLDAHVGTLDQLTVAEGATLNVGFDTFATRQAVLVTGDLQLDGVAVLGGHDNGDNVGGLVFVADDGGEASLTGSGDVVFASNVVRNALVGTVIEDEGAIGTSMTFVIGSGITVRGAGGFIGRDTDWAGLESLEVDLDLHGVVRAESAGGAGTIRIFTTSWENLGAIEAIGETEGEELGGGIIIARGELQNLVGGVLTGGVWTVGPASEIELEDADSNDYSITHNAATINFRGPDGLFLALDSLAENSGVLGIGANAVLNINGSFLQTAAGRTEIELAEAGESGRLSIAGTANLGGTLEVTLAPGFTPAESDTFEIVQYGSLGSQFDTFVAPPAGDCQEFSPEYGANALTVILESSEIEITALSLLDDELDEGETASLQGEFTGHEGHSYTATIDWGDGEQTVLLDVAPGVFGATHEYADDPSGPTDVYTITVTVSGGECLDGIATVDATVSNVEPLVLVAGPSSGVRGETLSFSGSFSDPGADEWSATVSFDGGPAQAVDLVGANFSFDHVFTTAGPHSLVVTVNDGDGEGTASQAVSITPFALRFDPITGTNSLFVGGTTGNDTISFTRNGGGAIGITLNGVSQGTFTVPEDGRIVVYGQAGADVIQATNALHRSMWLYGGAGNDQLSASDRSDVLFGGEGMDMLAGGGDRDLLIGGLGCDALSGGNGEDILLGGTTDYDANEVAINSLMQEWTRNISYALRVQHLQGAAGGLNGPYVLTDDTVDSDFWPDFLTGDAGRDFFFSNADFSGGLPDFITDLASNESTVEID